MKSKKSDLYATDSKIKSVFEDWYDPCELSKNELRTVDGSCYLSDGEFIEDG